MSVCGPHINLSIYEDTHMGIISKKAETSPQIKQANEQTANTSLQTIFPNAEENFISKAPVKEETI